MAQTKRPYFTKLDPALRAAMARYKEVVGVPEAQQIDRALREWLAERPEAWPLPKVKGAKGATRADRQRAPTRKPRAVL